MLETKKTDIWMNKFNSVFSTPMLYSWLQEELLEFQKGQEVI
jgi:hypothetical protein